MRIIIAGSRCLSLSQSQFDNFCDNFLSELIEPFEILSGHASGIDKIGETYAIYNHHKLSIFHADWDKFGKRAGYIRNYEMLKVADALLAFWDGETNGTKNMIETSIKKGIRVRVITVTEEPEEKLFDIIDYNRTG